MGSGLSRNAVRVYGLGFTAQGLQFMVLDGALGVYGLQVRATSLGFWIVRSGFRVLDSAFRV